MAMSTMCIQHRLVHNYSNPSCTLARHGEFVLLANVECTCTCSKDMLVWLNAATLARLRYFVNAASGL